MRLSGGRSLNKVEEFRSGQRCRQDFQHGIFERREFWTVLHKQSHELVEFQRSDRTPPDAFQESVQHFAAIDRFVAFVVACKEYVGVRFRRPLFVERSTDLNGVDQNVQSFLPAGRIGDISNVQELIPSRKCCSEFPEWVTLDIAERDIEVDKLGIVAGCRNRDVMFTDCL